MSHFSARRSLLVALCLGCVLLLDVWVHGAVASRMAARVHLRAPAELQHLFWDSEPYAAGINRYNAGQTPYVLTDLTNRLPFAYPPAFVWVGGALARLLPAPLGWRVYIAIYLLGVFGLQMVLGGFYLRRMRLEEVLALVCLAPLAAFLSTVFLSGNIHVVWYALALAAALPGLSRGRWGWFYGVALLAAVNQPVFVTLLILPVFTGLRRHIWYAALCNVLAAGAYFSQKIFSPGLFQQFQTTINVHLQASHDFGQGVFGICAYVLNGAHLRGLVLPAVVQVIFSGGILLVLYLLRQRVPWWEPRWWALLALGTVLINPRVMPYDAALALIPAVLFLCFFPARVGWPWGRYAALLAVTAVSMVLHAAVGITLLLLVGFVAGAWQLWSKGHHGARPGWIRREEPALVSANI